MKRNNLKVGLTLILFMSVLSIHQTISAFSIVDLLKKDNLIVNVELEEQVLAITTEKPNDEEDNNEEKQETQTVAVREEKIIEVAKGDSLNKIAIAHNTDYKRIFDANESISDPDIINPGQKIRIPHEDEQLVSRPIPEKAKVQPSVNPTRSSRSSNIEASQPPVAVSSDSVWDRLAQCESGGKWNLSTGNGYYGGLQFSPSTWRAVGGTGLPHQHSREEQIRRAEILLAKSGWGQWPSCSKKLGLR